jgi:hypothetical protein
MHWPNRNPFCEAPRSASRAKPRLASAQARNVSLFLSLLHWTQAIPAESQTSSRTESSHENLGGPAKTRAPTKFRAEVPTFLGYDASESSEREASVAQNLV